MIVGVVIVVQVSMDSVIDKGIHCVIYNGYYGTWFFKLFLKEEQKKHFENWETFWGRPGYGAPRAGKGPQKENLMRILHYPTQKVNNKNSYCLNFI